MINITNHKIKKSEFACQIPRLHDALPLFCQGLSQWRSLSERSWPVVHPFQFQMLQSVSSKSTETCRQQILFTNCTMLIHFVDLCRGEVTSKYISDSIAVMDDPHALPQQGPQGRMLLHDPGFHGLSGQRSVLCWWWWWAYVLICPDGNRFQ